MSVTQASRKAIHRAHEIITLPCDILTGQPVENPRQMRFWWSLFTGILAALWVVILVLPVPNARAQRSTVADDLKHHIQESTVGYQRINTLEQQLAFANERIRELQVAMDKLRTSNQDLQTTMAVMESTIFWIKLIAGFVIGALTMIGGLVAKKIWNVGR